MKSKLRLIITLLIIMLLYGCKYYEKHIFDAYDVSYTHNEFDQYKIYSLISNPLLKTEEEAKSTLMHVGYTTGIHFLPQKTLSVDTEYYSVEILYTGSDWFGIDDTKIIKLLIFDENANEKLIELYPLTSRTTNINPGKVSGGNVIGDYVSPIKIKPTTVNEGVRYEITINQLNMLKEANYAKLIVYGSDKFIVCHFHEINLRYIRTFLDEPFNQVSAYHIDLKEDELHKIKMKKKKQIEAWKSLLDT